MLNKIITFFLENKLVTFLVLIIFISWGIINSPFGWKTGIFHPIRFLLMPFRTLVKTNKLFIPNGPEGRHKI